MAESVSRVVTEIIGGLSVPLASRLVLQPTVALLFALGDGITDARTGNAFYFLRLGAGPPGADRQRALQVWDAFLKVFSAAVLADCVFQLLGFGFVYPIEAMATALVLTILPYAVLRSLVSWIARTWTASSGRVSS